MTRIPKTKLGQKLRTPETLSALAGFGVVLLATLVVGLAYRTQPQSPADLADRVFLIAFPDAYGPNFRLADRQLRQADRLAALERLQQAESLRWQAARRFARAGDSGLGAEAAMEANDRAANAFLALGWAYLRAGRGGALGIGGDRAQLANAEKSAACVVGLAPTRARADINAFVEELEKVLERAPSGICLP